MDLRNTFKSRIQENKIDENIYLAIIDNYTYTTDTLYRPIDKRFVQFYFNIKGTAAFHFNNKKQILKETHSILLFDSNTNSPIHISLSGRSKLLILAISIDKLIEIFPGIRLLKELNINQQLKIGTYEKIVLSQLENYNLKKEFENIYLTGKIIELLIFYFSDMDSINENKVSDKYSDKLNHVKQIILENISSPPSINKISEKVELSEYKIKTGFKKLFGKTIYAFILDEKLKIGKDKLERRTKLIKDIAFELGYENPSHFIEAFKKKYGVTPKQWPTK